LLRGRSKSGESGPIDFQVPPASGGGEEELVWWDGTLLKGGKMQPYGRVSGDQTGAVEKSIKKKRFKRKFSNITS